MLSRTHHWPVQGFVLQLCPAIGSPTHFLPPLLGEGLLQLRVLICIPPPHVFVQVPYPLHLPQLPFTGTEIFLMFTRQYIVIHSLLWNTALNLLFTHLYHWKKHKVDLTSTWLRVAVLLFFSLTRTFPSSILWCRIVTRAFSYLFASTARFCTSSITTPSSPITIYWNWNIFYVYWAIYCNAPVINKHCA